MCSTVYIVRTWLNYTSIRCGGAVALPGSWIVQIAQKQPRTFKLRNRRNLPAGQNRHANRVPLLNTNLLVFNFQQCFRPTDKLPGEISSMLGTSSATLGSCGLEGPDAPNNVFEKLSLVRIESMKIECAVTLMLSPIATYCDATMLLSKQPTACRYFEALVSHSVASPILYATI